MSIRILLVQVAISALRSYRVSEELIESLRLPLPVSLLVTLVASLRLPLPVSLLVTLLICMSQF
jgi:hypothetical protein